MSQLNHRTERTISLHEDAAGSYTASGLAVSNTSTYSLHIETSDNDYRSDPMKVYSTPPIDSIYWTISGADRLEIRTDSHNSDPNSTKYYLFSAVETYEYHAAINAHWKLVDHVAVERLPEEERYTCYIDERTPNVIASTKGLKEDRLTGVRVSIIERSSPKISAPRYTILIKQRAISQEEYTYQRLLLNSTEQQGSLFAQIPGEIPSNVRSTKDPGEYVLGYFRAQQIQELRYFIDNYQHQLPGGFYQKPYVPCQAEQSCYLHGIFSAPPGNCVDVSALSDVVGIVSIVEDANRRPLAYIWATAECSDCTLRGGTTIKPPFW